MEVIKIHGRSHYMYVKGRPEAAEIKMAIAEDFRIPESNKTEAEGKDSIDFCPSIHLWRYSPFWKEVEDSDSTDFSRALQGYIFKREGEIIG